MRTYKEYDELKECTFQPQIKENIPETGIVIVRGLGRHMELQEMKEKKRRD